MKAINVILNGFQTPLGESVLRNVFQDVSVDYCEYICQPDLYQPKLNVKQLRLFHPDLKKDEDDIAWPSLPPLDEELIEGLRECEAVFMNMMTRFEKTRPISYQERKRRYLRQLRYWNGVIEEKQINLFLSNTIPHEGVDLVIYCLCKYKKIPTLMIQEAGLMRDTLLILEDWEQSATQVRDAYKKLRDSGADGKTISLEPKFQEYFDSQVNKKNPELLWTLDHPDSSTVAWWKNVLCQMKSPGSFINQVSDFIKLRFQKSFWTRRAERKKRNKRVREQFAFYDRHAETPDLNRKYLYVALHMQPEASSCPMAGAYTDQLLIVQLLSAVLPDDVLIYVKEHPDQVVNAERGRTLDFYKDMIAVRNVRFVPRKYNTFRLIEGSQAVVTGTGGVGFESLFRGKPVLMFGHRFYQYAPGIFPIHSEEDCREAIKQIHAGAKPNLDDVRLFLRALQDVHVEGVVDPVLYHVSKLSEAETAASVGSALADTIRRVCAGAPAASSLR